MTVSDSPGDTATAFGSTTGAGVGVGGKAYGNPGACLDLSSASGARSACSSITSVKQCGISMKVQDKKKDEQSIPAGSDERGVRP
jgi:hypothetical protein